MDSQYLALKIKQLFDQLGLPSDKVVIGYGAGVVLRGLRKFTTDALIDVYDEQIFKDVIVPPAVSLERQSDGALVAIHYSGNINVEFYFGGNGPRVQGTLTDDGLNVATREELLLQYIWRTTQPRRLPTEIAHDARITKELQETNLEVIKT